HVKKMPRYLDNLKKYLHYKEKDPLVQLAIFFAQLLIIHPFMDGNGRVARALIPFFLYKKNIVSTPLFYLSAYFKRYRLQYFEKLFSISSKNEWEEWIRFFLKGVIHEGEESIQKAKAILSGYCRIDETLKGMGDPISVNKFIDALFENPISTTERWAEKAKMKPSFVLTALEKLQKKDLIVPYKVQPLLAVKHLLLIAQK
ncbi:MAG: Fic family protein, partial [Anaerolineae bacterium]